MQSHFLIISGMSGAGKTQVVRTLEDLNFFCIDNLPATLIPKFSELCRQTSEDKVAPAGALLIASWPRIEGATGLPARVVAITPKK